MRYFVIQLSSGQGKSKLDMVIETIRPYLLAGDTQNGKWAHLQLEEWNKKNSGGVAGFAEASDHERKQNTYLIVECYDKIPGIHTVGILQGADYSRYRIGHFKDLHLKILKSTAQFTGTVFGVALVLCLAMTILGLVLGLPVMVGLAGLFSFALVALVSSMVRDLMKISAAEKMENRAGLVYVGGEDCIDSTAEWAVLPVIYGLAGALSLASRHSSAAQEVTKAIEQQHKDSKAVEVTTGPQVVSESTTSPEQSENFTQTPGQQAYNAQYDRKNTDLSITSQVTGTVPTETTAVQLNPEQTQNPTPTPTPNS